MEKTVQLLWKVCGMKYIENILAVAELKPDLMGFIFAPESARYVGEDFVLPKLPEDIHKVGVFVNEDAAYMLEKASQYALSFLQLHGEEDPAVCEALHHKDFRVLKAFALDSSFDFSHLTAYEPYVNYFLFDTKGAARGGNGQPFDWNLLKQYRLAKPFWISGGIDLENIAGLMNFIHENQLPCTGIDVNSKFETSPGFKDPALLAQLKQIIQKT
ncbi:MAG TPA: N-(5'-phosphoribosyl)anthranilate isomerase [Microscillaceae bacterium]|jgi:phosphoribosylanthranilate isomerase|nr:N-(5'-phosphoribosyl)anthranilate isomerase [Microscillaceae bacterium]